MNGTSKLGLSVAAWERRQQREINKRVRLIRNRLKIRGGERIEVRSFEPAALNGPNTRRAGQNGRPVISSRGETFPSAFAASTTMGGGHGGVSDAVKHGRICADRRWFLLDSPEGRAVAEQFGKVVAA